MVANNARVFTDSSALMPFASSFCKSNGTWFVVNTSAVVVREYSGVKLLGIDV